MYPMCASGGFMLSHSLLLLLLVSMCLHGGQRLMSVSSCITLSYFLIQGLTEHEAHQFSKTSLPASCRESCYVLLPSAEITGCAWPLMWVLGNPNQGPRDYPASPLTVVWSVISPALLPASLKIDCVPLWVLTSVVWDRVTVQIKGSNPPMGCAQPGGLFYLTFEALF